MFDKKRSDATSKGLEAAQKERQKILTEMIKTFPEAEKFPGFDEALKTYFTTSSHLIPDIYETGGTPAVLKAFLGDALWRLESQPHQDEENKRRQKAVRSLLQKYGAQQSAGGAAAAGSHS
jgi:hypothetical protein